MKTKEMSIVHGYDNWIRNYVSGTCIMWKCHTKQITISTVHGLFIEEGNDASVAPVDLILDIIEYEAKYGILRPRQET